MKLPRGFMLFPALALATVFPGCMNTDTPTSVPPAASPMAAIPAPAPAPPMPAASPSPSVPLTAEQNAKLRAVGFTDQQIAALVASGQAASMLAQVANTGATMATAAPPTSSAAMPNREWVSRGARGAARPEKLAQVVELWVTSKRPDSSYGQFTYLLLKRDHTPEGVARNLKILKAVLGGRIDTVAEQERVGTPREKLNLVLVPMKSKVPDEPRTEADYAAVLAAYDWAWASAMLADLKFDGGRGPFLYSAAERWNPRARTLPECIKQDLSGAPDAMVVVWWTEFLHQSSRRDFWKKDKIQVVALTLREAIERTAEQFDPSQAAVKKIFALIGLPAGSNK